MDNKQAVVYRSHFRKVVGTVPVLIASTGGRWALVMQNEGPADVYVGMSGLTVSNGMLLASANSLADNYSKDNWWAVAASSSGTVSGFELV